jgi:hypothetical protein
MSSEERLKLLGRLEETKMKAQQTKLQMVGLRDSVRGMLDKYEPIEVIHARAAAELAVQLAALQEHYRELLERMQSIKRDLGME